MEEKLQAIINGETTGDEAVVVLEAALADYGSSMSRALKLGEMIKKAEDYLVYGMKGRPLQQTFR